MGSRWRLNYTLAQLLLVVVMVANVCGVVVAVRADMRPHVEIVEGAVFRGRAYAHGGSGRQSAGHLRRGHR